MVYHAGVGFQILFSFSINLLIGYNFITVDYQLIVRQDSCSRDCIVT